MKPLLLSLAWRISLYLLGCQTSGLEGSSSTDNPQSATISTSSTIGNDPGHKNSHKLLWILLGTLIPLFILLLVVLFIIIYKISQRKPKRKTRLKRSKGRSYFILLIAEFFTSLIIRREVSRREETENPEHPPGSVYSPQPWKSGRVYVDDQSPIDEEEDQPRTETPKWNGTDLWQIDSSDLRISSKIGRGETSDVFFGEYSAKLPILKVQPDLEKEFELTNICYQVAVKMPVKPENNATFLKEISLMKEIGYHQNLLSMVGCSSNPKSLMILTEYCGQGNLRTLLRGYDKENREFLILKLHFTTIAKQIADALAYLISKKIVHRDVAARNILLTKKKKPKLADFGMSRHIDDFTVREDQRLPLRWTAPEVIEFGIFSEKSDVWSFGILLWEMYTIGGQPYDGIDEEKIFDLIKKALPLEIPADTPENMRQLMTSCWKISTSDRPTFSSITQTLSSSPSPEKLPSHF